MADLIELDVACQLAHEVTNRKLYYVIDISSAT